MKAKGLLIAAATIVIGCATTSTTGTRSSDGDGLTCERRVKVAAVPEEYAWVKEHYPGAKVNMQSLSRCGESPIDELQIRTADGRDVTLHFDISSFF